MDTESSDSGLSLEVPDVALTIEVASEQDGEIPPETQLIPLSPHSSLIATDSDEPSDNDEGLNSEENDLSPDNIDVHQDHFNAVKEPVTPSIPVNINHNYPKNLVIKKLEEKLRNRLSHTISLDNTIGVCRKEVKNPVDIIAADETRNNYSQKTLAASFCLGSPRPEVDCEIIAVVNNQGRACDGNTGEVTITDSNVHKTFEGRLGGKPDLIPEEFLKVELTEDSIIQSESPGQTSQTSSEHILYNHNQDEHRDKVVLESDPEPERPDLQSSSSRTESVIRWAGISTRTENPLSSNWFQEGQHVQASQPPYFSGSTTNTGVIVPIKHLYPPFYRTYRCICCQDIIGHRRIRQHPEFYRPNSQQFFRQFQNLPGNPPMSSSSPTISSPTFTCHLCGNAYLTQIQLKRHQLRHGEKKFQCRTCFKKFCTPRELNGHSVVHTKDRPFLCPHCPRSFRQSSSYYFHLRTHIICENCSLTNVDNNVTATADSTKSRISSSTTFGISCSVVRGHGSIVP